MEVGESLKTMQIALEPTDIEAIAHRVAELIKPILCRDDEDETLNIEQASELLGKSKEQIYQWVHGSRHGANDFPFMKAGRSLRFSKKDLLKWMKISLENG